MEIEIKKTKNIEDFIHQFYCDRCGNFLGESKEHPDGWYEKLGEFERKYNCGNGWLKLNKCYCEKCAKIIDWQINETLRELGFE